jgi:ATP-dependent Lon protease
MKLPDGTCKVLVEGQVRAEVREYLRTDDFYEARAEAIADEPYDKGRGGSARPSTAAEF